MSHRVSPSSFRHPVFVVLLVFMVGILASCSTAPNSPSPDEPGNRELPLEESRTEASPHTDAGLPPDSSGESSEEAIAADSGLVEEPDSEVQEEASSQEAEIPAETDDTSASTIASEFPDIQQDITTQQEAATEAAEEDAETEIASPSPAPDVELSASSPDSTDPANAVDATEEVPMEESTMTADEGEGERGEISPDSNPEASSSPASESPESASDEAGDRAWRLVQNRGRLRVGIDPSIGYTYLRANTDTMSFEGFEWDILEAIGKELDIEIEPVYIPWDNQLEALESNRVDTILGGRDALGVDETRFATTIPYYSSPQRIVVREELAQEIQHLSDLFGRKVGTVADSAGAAVVEVFNQDRANALTLSSSRNPSRLFEQLRQSQVDAIVIDQPIAVAEAAIVETARAEDESLPFDGEVPDVESGSVSTSNPDAVEPLEVEPDGKQESGTVESATSESQSPNLSAADLDETGTILINSNVTSLLGEGEPTQEVIASEETLSEDTSRSVSLHIVGEPMFPTPLVGIVKADRASIGQALDEAIATLERNGTITSILEKWEL